MTVEIATTTRGLELIYR